MIELLLIVGSLLIAFGAALFKYKAFALQDEYSIEPLETPENPIDLPVETLPEPLPPNKPPTMPTKTKREHLYDVSKASIGIDMSPLDRAPDALGCMESLDGVYLAAFGEHLLAPADRLSTAMGYAAMRVDPRLTFLNHGEELLPGDIAIAPSGQSTKGAPHGHALIRGKQTYMSNNSGLGPNDPDSGKWEANYNIPNVKLVFHDTLGFPIFHFRVKGDMETVVV